MPSTFPNKMINKNITTSQILIDETDTKYIQGPPGYKGDKGDKGEIGNTGKMGVPGKDGKCECICRNENCSYFQLGDMKLVPVDGDIEVVIKDKKLRLFELLERVENLENMINNSNDNTITITI